MDESGMKCWWCGIAMTFDDDQHGRKPPYNRFTIDHVKMKRMGGKDGFHNLVASCWLCNQRRCLRKFRDNPHLLFTMRFVDNEGRDLYEFGYDALKAGKARP